ncbi:putative quinol monooxygenase [Devosia sp.]|uniref:putative quinol monooxygenase n=1 Tax=Devosia sp. TaxID=1871048 RepID=UPI002AFE3D84|nr:putative quinol monooxygenase [Devosia sp.]
MGKVYLEGYLEVPQGRIKAVSAALPLHIALTRREPGCLAFEVTRSPDEPTHFLVSEIFASEEAFAAHQQRAGTSDWARVTAGMARHYTIRKD